jgi:hypothetical protein
MKKGRKEKRVKIFGKKKEEEPVPAAAGSPKPEEGKAVETKAPQRYRIEDGKIIFPGRMVPMWRPPEPEPAPPEGEDILQFEKLPLSEITELLQDFPRGKKNRDGIHFAGGHIRVRLRNQSTLEGWLSEVDLKKFRQEGAVKGWRPTPRR